MTEERSASDRLKARLTGAVALLLIGVIGWFWLLDSDNPVEPVAQESTIPPAPQIQPFSVPQPAAPADIKPVGSERDAPVQPESTPEPAPTPAKPQPAKPIAAMPAPSQPIAETRRAERAPAETAKPAAKPAAPVKPAPVPVPAEKFELDTNNLPVAWVVQVGAMGSQAAADKLKADLIAKGFKAFTQPGKLANGTATIKVYVGPKLSRERADAQKKQIDAALKTDTMVVRFPPA